MDFKNKVVVVIGLARSGIAVIDVLTTLGAKVRAYDSKSKEALGETYEQLSRNGVEIFLGQETGHLFENAELVVVSPGVPKNNVLLQRAQQNGISIWSEVELAYRLCKAPIIAITGTNGKTTTTTLIGEIFKAWQDKVIVGGNIGLPLAKEALKTDEEYAVVAEISSFQLEWVDAFRPKVSLILNITEDHLDRHGNMKGYIDAKAEIFKNQGAGDYVILNYDDPEVKALASRVKSNVVFFSRVAELPEGLFVRDKRIILKWHNEEREIIPVKEIGIKGTHNLENALAAAGAAYVMGVDIETIRKVLAEFQGVEHRLEFVAEINGVRFVNDSKGTNPDATVKGLSAFDQPIILIAGGREKGTSFREFAMAVKEKVKKVILIGEAKPKIEEALREVGYREITEAVTMVDAVKLGYKLADSGDAVLLSPGCASFDMFQNYEVRGRVFKNAVLALRGD